MDTKKENIGLVRMPLREANKHIPEYEGVLSIIKKFDVKVFVEIGVYYGDMAKYLLEHHEFDKYYAVDSWNRLSWGLESYTQEAVDMMYEKCKEQLISFSNVEIIKSTSFQASQTFKPKSVDMVYIDAGHDENEVHEDIINWEDKARKIIAGHDYILGGVQRGVRLVYKDLNIINTPSKIWWVHA